MSSNTPSLRNRFQLPDFMLDGAYRAAVLTHFSIDILNSSRNLIVAILAINLGMDNTQLAINLLIYNIGTALTQPFFGLLADRIGPRWLILGGTGWMVFFFSLAAMLTDWPALIAITAAGVGSGALHPAGTMVASQTSQTNPTRATAVFFMGGQLGLFLGPVLAGILLEQFDRPGYLVLPTITFLALITGWQWYRHHPPHIPPTPKQQKEAITAPRPPTRSYILLPLIILSYSTVGIGAITFTPKLFIQLSYETSYVGWLSGLFMMGSAAGGIIGGSLADRYEGKYVILGSMLASILPLYFYIPASAAIRPFILLLAGFFNGMPHSILVLDIQALLPGRRALASGLALGGMFASGALGSYVIGLIADEIGLGITLQGTAVLPLVAFAFAYFLPRRNQ